MSALPVNNCSDDGSRSWTTCAGVGKAVFSGSTNQMLAKRASIINRSLSSSLCTVNMPLTALGESVIDNMPIANIRLISLMYSRRSPWTKADGKGLPANNHWRLRSFIAASDITKAGDSSAYNCRCSTGRCCNIGRFARCVGKATRSLTMRLIAGDGPYIIGVATCGSDAHRDTLTSGTGVGVDSAASLIRINGDDVSTSCSTDSNRLS